MSELLPCPFCGGEASIGEGSLSLNGDRYYFVNCADCLASTNILIPESAPYTKQMATKYWNRRTTPQRADGRR